MFYFLTEYAVIVGSFIQGADGHNVPRLLAYPMNKEMVSDPVFVEFAQAACPFMVPGIYPRDYDVSLSMFIVYLLLSLSLSL